MRGKAGENGMLNREELEQYFRYLVRGREDYVHRRKDAVRDAVDQLFEELDTNKDGRIDTAERRQAKALLEEMQANYVFGLDVRAPVMNGSVQLLVPYRRSLAGCWPGDDELH